MTASGTRSGQWSLLFLIPNLPLSVYPTILSPFLCIRLSRSCLYSPMDYLSAKKIAQKTTIKKKSSARFLVLSHKFCYSKCGIKMSGKSNNLTKSTISETIMEAQGMKQFAKSHQHWMFLMKRNMYTLKQNADTNSVVITVIAKQFAPCNDKYLSSCCEAHGSIQSNNLFLHFQWLYWFIFNERRLFTV